MQKNKASKAPRPAKHLTLDAKEFESIKQPDNKKQHLKATFCFRQKTYFQYNL